MKKQIRKSIAGYLIVALFASCSQSDEGRERNDTGCVHFTGHVNELSRAIDSGFEDEDAIGVFAFTEGSGFTSNSYATNVKYVFNDGQFNPANGEKGIFYDGKEGLSYWAIYPYCEEAGSNFTFTVKEDQNKVMNYTYSDLMTASVGKTTSMKPNLTFSHRLSCITINVTFEDKTIKASQLNFQHALKSASVNMTTNTFTGTGTREAIIKSASNGNGQFKVVLPPQPIERGTSFATITDSNGKNYIWVTSNDLVLESGNRYTYNLNVSLKGNITFTADIDPWGKPEESIESIIPPALLDSLERYMPIYRGNNPPNVEGTYLVEPMTAVYCQDYEYAPGEVVTSKITKFSNQNNTNHTLEFFEKNIDNSDYSESYTSHIIGDGNNFTVYLENIGEVSGIYTRTAILVSGIMSETGIVKYYGGFIMLEKGNDPTDKVMDAGVYRIFRDGNELAAPTAWTRSLSSNKNTGYSTKSFNRNKK